ncbi:S8 family serine peptidase [Nonomuraea jiangxiensis]|uniref:DNA-binding beta-propeller fold protein YncE n=1 Tax=Nonomuraea jiangxiensis TaxID=633440 RepID=A0A1G8LG96_9ACTN|nr:S8 family serine peptidase [Nonomuraea jiangxiensis]SDI54645.1 DNA-binding beta-propeller fold protein YncE [Nonomuraea jiangxiensis]
MDLSRSPGISRRLLATAAAAGLILAGLAWPGAASAQAAPEEQKTYIVQMAPDPVATYEGDVAGLAKTKPDQGEKIEPGSTEVTRYADHLRGRHDAALRRVGGKKVYEYLYSYGGFAATLTASQAAQMRTLPDVVAVTEDRKVSVQTSSTPAFLGLDARGGLWDQLGGPTGGKDGEGAGDGLVIGVIDSGIWADSKSFADPDGSGRRYGKLPGFTGTCTRQAPDESWNGGLCNGKLVAARHFDAGWGGDEGVKQQLPWEFLSPRDYNGHGTHTASTAAGNHDVPVTGPAAGFGSISGIAPRARVAAYKALWSTQDASTANGYYSDLVAAIDQAVADGVDVINYSVSGTATDFLDPAEVAFMAAAEAGVFVSVAGGNSGPAAATVEHPSPWVTTVAAGTHNRGTQGSVTLGNGTSYSGASLAATKAGPAPLVDAAAVGLPGADPTLVAQCYAARDNGGKPVLDPAKARGKIVVCDRGVTPRVNKSVAVAEAGGIGMILTNTDDNSLNADLHSVPTVHLALKDRQAVKDYAATEGATATVQQARIIDDVPAPYVAEFSSRGPISAGGGDLLKPDLIAPGQDILAAFAPPGAGGAEFNFASGTSMATPHVAGLAALLKDLHPDWSPMAVKSALMTSGYDVKDGPGTDPSVIFGQGAGHVRPNSAADPGLVYDSGVKDWLAFLCGNTKGVQQEMCDQLAKKGYSFDASDMNVPSIAIGRLPGTQTVTREVTNVGRSTATYTASLSGLRGIEAKVSPSTLRLKRGETKSFTVTFTRTTAPMNAYVGGQLTWQEQRKHTVRVPVVVRPVPEAWAATYGAAGGSDSAEQIALDPKGKRVYVSGASYGSTPGALSPQIATVAYDAATGAEVWSKGYRGPGGDYDEPSAIEVSPDGSRLYVVGVSAGSDTGNDAVTIAYDTATGAEVWVARHAGVAAGTDNGNGLALSPDGKNVYVTGMTSLGEGGKEDYFTVSYRAEDGTQAWLAHYDGPGGSTDDAREISVAPDGSKIFVTGQSAGEDGTGLTNWGTVAYDAGTGAQLWAAQLDGPAHGLDIPSAMEVAADGKAVFVSGATSHPRTQTDMTTVAYDTTTGKELWSDTFDGPAHGSDNPHDLALSPDGGRLFVTGNTDGEGTRSDYTTIAYDPATGQRSWVRRHSGQAGADDIAWDVAVTPDGGKVLITGQSSDDASRGTDFLTIAYDPATGEPVWTGRYDGTAGQSDDAHALAVDTAAGTGVRIFVTGSAAMSGDPMYGLEVDFATVAYFEPWKKS